MSLVSTTRRQLHIFVLARAGNLESGKEGCTHVFDGGGPLGAYRTNANPLLYPSNAVRQRLSLTYVLEVAQSWKKQLV